MRRSLVAIAAALVCAGTSAASDTPSLRFASLRPVVVRGAGFPAHRRLRIVVADAQHSWTKRVVVRASGGFSVSFGVVPLDRCSAVARAFGANGLRVSTKPADPLCPEPIPVP